MEKIKDVSKVILAPHEMLGELIKPKRFIVAPDGARDEDSYVVIVAVGADIKDMIPGDIVIKYGSMMNAFHRGDKTYVVISRHGILIAVTPDNFINPDIITENVNV